ncbi:hypothetical protein IWQ62_001757 [Dispira parvispora]|uniref:Thioredoxin-dependent peroxiredoxin n=1 Tax=Dispira parvispora TaxID=1520584 RepID=A0A9W8ARU9_9FUNG|nr:hypothetical protein IWQ62_001757 [Dispira parvispora]
MYRMTLRYLSPQVVSRRAFHSSRWSAIQTGEPIPNTVLQEKSPANTVNAHDFFQPYQKAVLIGVPGAFTPGCSRTHVPGYVTDFDQLHAKGVDMVACVSVNDAFVMDAWSQQIDKHGKLRFLADPRAELVRAMDLAFDASGVLGGLRSKRFAMVLEHGVVKRLEVEPDNTGLSCSLAKNLVEIL